MPVPPLLSQTADRHSLPVIPAPIPAATIITFPTATDTFVDATTLTWSENIWTKSEDGDDKKYWSAPELPDEFFYWQHAQHCYFTKRDTMKRMNSDYRLYIVSRAQDNREREATRQAKQTKTEADSRQRPETLRA